MKNQVFFLISSISPIFFKIFALPGQEGGGEGDDGDDELHDDTVTQGWECGMHCAEGWVIMIFIPGYHGRARVVCWCVQTAGVTFGESLPRPCTQCLRDDTMPQTRDQGVLCILDMCKI